MNRSLAALAAALLASAPVFADLQPTQRELRPVSDAAMVVTDRGAKLEVLPAERATATVNSTGVRVLHQTVVKNVSAAIGPHQLGVVFNHAMQARGYITGEISFKVKAGQPFNTPSTPLYPGLERIVAPSVYIVTARTPAEFIQLLKRLQARSDLEWVEPTITYDAAVVPNSAR